MEDLFPDRDEPSALDKGYPTIDKGDPTHDKKRQQLASRVVMQCG